MLNVDGSVAPKYVVAVLDELGHYLVTRVLVLHCFKTWRHAAHGEIDDTSTQLQMTSIWRRE